MTDEQIRQSEIKSLPKELVQAKQLMNQGEINKAFQIVFELEKRGDLSAKELFSCKLLKATLLYKSLKYSDAIIYTDQLLQENQKQGDLLAFLDILTIQSLSHIVLGHVSKSEDLIKKADDTFKKIKATSIIDLRERESLLVRIKANICTWKGQIHRSLELNKKAFELAEGSKDKGLISTPLINIVEKYAFLGDYDNAKLYAERVIQIQYQPLLIFALGYLIDILLDKGDIERAKHYFQQVSEIREKDKSKINEVIYRYYKALLLKTSLRSKNRVKSEKLLKQIIDDKDVSGGFKTFWTKKRIFTIINLCDLLLIELRITNYPEIIDEIQLYIQKLLDFAEQQHSYWILCETYLLQAKLALLSLDLKEARRLLTQAQQIAEKYGLSLLARKISNEHDELLKQLEMWENLKESKAPMAERMKLSRLNEQMEGMVKKRVKEYPKLEAEQPILFAIMTKEGEIVLSSPFTADMTIDETQFGEFLSSCNTFCDQIFSESFDRVKFGQYTILISAVEHFCIYYMFQGRSYSAQQKLTHFCEAFNKDPTIMKFLENVVNENKTIAINEHPSLENLIVESFLSDPQKFQMPFKAYEGDEPFIFVSYAHTDKLQVYPIIDYLNKKGIHIWYDEGIPISENWKKSIVENLERCKAFLLFITPHILESDYVRKEISFASKRQKAFFGVYLKETELPRELEFDIADIQ
ncbi:MAG: TIR domain-containing protein, partial [Promethearchaeota archaeon]